MVTQQFFLRKISHYVRNDNTGFSCQAREGQEGKRVREAYHKRTLSLHSEGQFYIDELIDPAIH